MSFVASLLRFEQLLECQLCGSLLQNTRTLTECGHRFCYDCVYSIIGEERRCPSCHLPAIVRNMRKDQMHDTIVACVEKIKKLMIGPLPTLSLEKSPSSKERNTWTQQNGGTLEKLATKRSSSSTTGQQASTTTSETVDSSLLRGSEYKGFTMDSEVLVNAAISAEEKHASEQAAAENNSPKNASQSVQSSNATKGRSSQSIKTGMPRNASQSAGGIRSQSSQSMRANDQAMNENDRISAANDTQPELNPEELLEDMLRFSQLPDDEIEPVEDEQKNAVPISSIKRRRSTDINHAEKRDHPISLKLPSPQKRRKSSDTPAPTSLCKECGVLINSTEKICAKCTSLKMRKTNHFQDPPAPGSSTQPSKAPLTIEQTVESLSVSVDDDNAESASIDSCTRSRWSRSNTIHVLFTGIPEEQVEEVTTALIHSPLKIAPHDSLIRDSREITHVITKLDKNGLCRRTEKYLQGVIFGKWIVDSSWLLESAKAKKWLPEEQFEAFGDSVLGLTHGPCRGRERRMAREPPIFDGLKFYFFGDFDGKYNKSMLLQLCRAAGGQVLSRRPSSTKPVSNPGNLHDNNIDPKYPIIIVTSNKISGKKNQAWIQQQQTRDVKWMLNCISRCRNLYH